MVKVASTMSLFFPFLFVFFRDRLKRDIIYKNPFDDAYVFKEPNSRDQTTINMSHSGFIFKKTH
jgi:hypothetical protein